MDQSDLKVGNCPARCFHCRKVFIQITSKPWIEPPKTISYDVPRIEIKV